MSYCIFVYRSDSQNSSTCIGFPLSPDERHRLPRTSEKHSLIGSITAAAKESQLRNQEGKSKAQRRVQTPLRKRLHLRLKFPDPRMLSSMTLPVKRTRRLVDSYYCTVVRFNSKMLVFKLCIFGSLNLRSVF